MDILPEASETQLGDETAAMAQLLVSDVAVRFILE